MPRRRLIISNAFPYHVTSRSNNKEWFYIPLPLVGNIFAWKLAGTSRKYGTLVHAFVLMSNHFHLILTSPEEPMGEVMRHLLTEVSKAIQSKANRINHIFGARYTWSILDSAYGVAYVYKYVLRNPVRAGMCEKTEFYPYSSLHGDHAKHFPIAEGIDPIWRLVPRDMQERRAWLNGSVNPVLEMQISKGLRKAHFVFSRSNAARKDLSDLESQYGIPRDDTSLGDRYLLGPAGD